MTYKEIKEQIRKLGSVPEEDFEREFAPTLYEDINDVCYDLAQSVAPIRRHITVVNEPPENLIRSTEAYFVHRNADVIFTATGAVAYTFECSGNGDVAVEVFRDGEYEQEELLHCFSNGIFNRVCGFIPAQQNETVRLRFTGNYTYTVRNTALYATKTSPYPEDIPPFGKFTSFDMKTLCGSAFMRFDDEHPVREADSERTVFEYETRDDGVLMLPADIKGFFDIYYHKNPAKFFSDSAKGFETDLSETAQRLIPLGVAAKIYADEDRIKAKNYQTQYENLKQQLYAPMPVSDKWTDAEGWL